MTGKDKSRIVRTNDGRLWLTFESHPRSTAELIVCRQLKSGGWLGAVAVFSRYAIAPAALTWGDAAHE